MRTVDPRLWGGDGAGNIGICGGGGHARFVGAAGGRRDTDSHHVDGRSFCCGTMGDDAGSPSFAESSGLGADLRSYSAGRHRLSGAAIYVLA